jgi:hypothetical protein
MSIYNYKNQIGKIIIHPITDLMVLIIQKKMISKQSLKKVFYKENIDIL